MPLQLHPVPQSSALHTLLTAASHPQTTCDVPLPSPCPTHTQVRVRKPTVMTWALLTHRCLHLKVPRLNSDAELSCLSLLGEQSSLIHPHTPIGQPRSRHSSSTSSYVSIGKENTTPVHTPLPSSPPPLLYTRHEGLSKKESGVEQLLWQQEQQLRALQEQVCVQCNLLAGFVQLYSRCRIST